LISKRKALKKKLNKIRRNKVKTIKIGCCCSAVTVKATEYYKEQIYKVDKEMQEIQAKSKKENLGIAFISFKQRDHVADTLEEIELVKQNLMNDKKTMKLGIANWKVEKAYPPSDILWNDIQNFQEEPSTFKNLAMILLHFGLSFFVVLLTVCLDRYLLDKELAASLII